MITASERIPSIMARGTNNLDDRDPPQDTGAGPSQEMPYSPNPSKSRFIRVDKSTGE
jgi:hypothetical protein